MVDVNNFAREMMLDLSECENALYILPQLTRDSFSKKGLFYRTDKILLQNYSASFQHPSALKAKLKLEAADAFLQSICSQKETQEVISDLLSCKLISNKISENLFEDDKNILHRNIVVYVFF